MGRLQYNSDFTELIDTLMMEIRDVTRSLNWFSITNGYVEGTNTSYFNGIRENGKSKYPVLVGLIVTNDWKFHSHSWSGGGIHDAAVIGDVKGGGNVVFDKKLTIEFRPLFERFEKFELNGLKAEPDEYRKVESLIINFEFGQKDETRRKITKSDIKKIIKEIKQELPHFIESINEATSQQIARRFDEVMSADEELALNHLPKEVEDIFIF